MPEEAGEMAKPTVSVNIKTELESSDEDERMSSSSSIHVAQQILSPPPTLETELARDETHNQQKPEAGTQFNHHSSEAEHESELKRAAAFKADTATRRVDSRIESERRDAGDERVHKSTHLASQESATSSCLGDHAGPITELKVEAEESVHAAAMEHPTVVEETTETGASINATERIVEPAQVPTLAEEISKAVAGGNGFGKGDLAIIMDIDDLSKTYLLPSEALFRASGVLREEVAALDRSNTNVREINFLLLLEAQEDTTHMPVLTLLDQTSSLEALQTGAQHKPYSRTADKAIKPEPSDTDGNTTCVAVPQIDWVKGYELFFSIAIVGIQPPRIFTVFNKDASVALPQIETVIAIAKYLDALPAVTSTITHLFYKYVGNRTLWGAIASEPASWLLLGLAIEDKSVYEEAFRHLVGRHPRWPWAKPFRAIPKSISSVIDAKALGLYMQRLQIDHQLATLTLAAKPLGHDVAVNVNQHNQPVIYNTVNIWRDWITEHISYLSDEERFGEGNMQPQKTWLCAHPKGACLTLSGFYRAVAQGGEAYLPIEHILMHWNNKYEKNNSVIRKALIDLKGAAAKIVEPLVQSTLQYERKDSLGYLTCVKVEETDVPWANDELDVAMQD